MAYIVMKYALVLDQDVLRLLFSNSLTESDLFYNTSNFTIENLTGSTTPMIMQVLPYRPDTPSHINLMIKGLVVGDTYRVVVASDIYRGQSGGRVLESYAVWKQIKTKVDSAISNVTSAYNIEQGTVFKVLFQSIMLSDEAIGGAFDNKITPAAKHFGGNWGGSDWGGSNWGGD